MAEAVAVRALPRLTPGGLRRGAALAVSRGLAVGAQMAVQMAVGFVSGPAGIGLLQLHMAWSSLAGELVGGGEPSRALRDTSIRYERGEGRAIRGAMQRASLRILGFGSALAALVAVLILITGDEMIPGSGGFMLVATVLLAAPLFALGRLCAESLKGLGDPLAAVTLENLLLPGTILLACAAMAAGILPASAGALLGAATLGVVLTFALLGQRFFRKIRTVPEGTRETQDSHSFSAGGEQTFLWLNGLLNIAFLQLPFLVLPWFVDATEIGLFAVAHKLVNIITTLLILLAAVYGPRFAKAAAARDAAQMTQLLHQTQQISVALFTPTWVVLLLAAQPLGELFSLEAGSLGPIVLILGCGQLANASTGLSGVLLSMSGGARKEFQNLVISALITLGAALAIALADTANSSARLELIAMVIAGGIGLRNLLTYLSARRHIHLLGTTQ